METTQTSAGTHSSFKLDFIVIGNQNAGKTSLIKSFTVGEGTPSILRLEAFSHTYTPTIGMSLDKRLITVDEQQISLFIWDTAGQ